MKERLFYGLVLTYDDKKVPELRAGYYAETGDDSVVKMYEQEGIKHLRALFESIRRHKRSRKGGNWEGKIIAAISCLKDKPRRGGIDYKPERLHIHVLVLGTPGRTMAGWIYDYWRKRFGITEMKKLVKTSQNVETMKDYVYKQALCTRYITL